jgi:hypothetical protein
MDRTRNRSLAWWVGHIRLYITGDLVEVDFGGKVLTFGRNKILYLYARRGKFRVGEPPPLRQNPIPAFPCMVIP